MLQNLSSAAVAIGALRIKKRIKSTEMSFFNSGKWKTWKHCQLKRLLILEFLFAVGHSVTEPERDHLSSCMFV